MHVALLGSRGFIGRAFADSIQSRGWKLSTIDRSDCSIEMPGALSKTLSVIAPDFLINSAGYTGKPNVDACEVNQTECLAGNAVLPGIVADACRENRVHWGHISSGCIYTGVRPDGQGFTEADPPNFSFRQDNCSFYSGTKALGEEILANDLDRCYVWRLRIPFSHIDCQRNYLSKILNYEMLLDVENSLSHLTEFVDAALDCFETSVPFGIYNMTNPGSITTSEIVEMVRESGVSSKEFRFFDSEEHFMRVAASTPRSNCVLDSHKAVSAGLKLTPIRECLARTLQAWLPASAVIH